MSRDLDASIAEKILGWRREQRRYSSTLTRTLLMPPTEPERKPGYGFRYGERVGDLWVAHQMPHFSADIAAAWQVVDELHRRDAAGSGEFWAHLILLYWGGKWVATFEAIDEDDVAGWYEYQDFRGVNAVRSDSAPEAICKAALAAVRVQV